MDVVSLAVTVDLFVVGEQKILSRARTDHVRDILGVHDEEDRSKDSALWYAAAKSGRLRMLSIVNDRLCSVSQI